MIVHQKPYALASRIIMLGITRNIVCERKGKQVNRETYVKWTSGEQFCCHKAKGDDANLKGTYEEGYNQDVEAHMEF
jgi:hypothetical protein